MTLKRTELESCTEDTSIFDGKVISPLVKKIAKELTALRERKKGKGDK